MTTWEPIYPQIGDEPTCSESLTYNGPMLSPVNAVFHFPDNEITKPVIRGKTHYERLADRHRERQQARKSRIEKVKRALKSISRLRIRFK